MVERDQGLLVENGYKTKDYLCLLQFSFLKCLSDSNKPVIINIKKGLFEKGQGW